MFAQTVREEKMNCGSVSSSAGGMEQPEGGSQLKRKNESKTAGGSSSRSSSGRQYQPQLHQQKNHRQQSSHHAKYATIAHPNFTQHHYGQAIGAATLGRNRQQAADHEPKRTRNTFDPRYRSHDPLEVVSSTTGGGGRSPQPVGEAPSSSQSTSDVGSYSGRNATEHSDSLSDDMSLLDVGAVSAHEDSLEGAGGDTSDERETIVRRRYQRQSPRSSSTAAVRGTGQKSAAAAGYYASQMEPLADRSIKSSTNSLPSVAGHRNLALHLKFKSHQSAIDAKRKQFFLALDQEPFQPLNRSNMADLPSPSSTSLHSGHSHLIAEELGTKSSSAPVLLKDEENVLTVARANLRYSRSQSDRHLAAPPLQVSLSTLVVLWILSTMHRRMSSIREYKFFRSFSAKIENWHIRKAESLWKRMRERKIAGNRGTLINVITDKRDH
uniref:Uncharacterized protein n=1 Tax=Anopheles atroparvus TaxID=41427 RepID=A0A182IJZ0_ANOAO